MTLTYVIQVVVMVVGISLAYIIPILIAGVIAGRRKVESEGKGKK